MKHETVPAPFRLLSARVVSLGSAVCVRVPAVDVRRFRAVWPCSGLNPERGGSFVFDKRNGDLLDLGGGFVDRRENPEIDGGAICALADDAKAFWEAEETALRGAGLHETQTGCRVRR